MQISNNALPRPACVTLSPADVVSWDNCHRQYWYEHVRRVRVLHPSADSIFSAILEEVVQSYLMAQSLGITRDPCAKWVEWWREAVTDHSPSFSIHRSAQDLERTGLALMRQLPKAWARSGLAVAMNAREEPLIHRPVSACIGTRGGITVQLQGLFGVLLKSSDGGVGLLEITAVHSPHTERFVRRSDLLTGSQLLVNSGHSYIEDPRVTRVGFWDFVYTRSDAAIAPPLLVGARTEREMSEYRDKCWWIAEDIAQGRFPYTPRWQFNTPCTRCAFADHCLYQDETGLNFPSWWAGEPDRKNPSRTTPASHDAEAPL